MIAHRLAVAAAGRALGALFFFSTLFYAGLGSFPASAATLKEALQQCDSPRANDEERPVIELLVLAGSEIDATARERYRAMAGDVITWSCANGAMLEIRPIDSQSREESYVFSETAPTARRDGGFNPFTLRDKRAAFVYRAWKAVDDLYQRSAGTHADYYGAIETAANAANAVKNSKRVTLVAIGHGWPQQDPDLFSAGRDPAKSTATFITRLRTRSAPPNFHGASVVLVGVSSGPRSMGQSGHLFGLCEDYWLPVINVSKGAWRRCWPEVPPFLRVTA